MMYRPGCCSFDDEYPKEIIVYMGYEPIRHGHWIVKDGVYGVAYCSECGYELKVNDTNYCPNCGAKMDEVAK